MINNACRTNQIMALAFHAQRMLVQKGGAFSAPAFRAIERAGFWIALTLIIPVTLTLVAPPNRTVDRWTNGHDADLNDGNDGAGNENACDGSSPTQARYSRKHIQNIPQTSWFCPFVNCPPNRVLTTAHSYDAQAISITLRFDRLRLNRRRLSFRVMRQRP